MIELLHFIRDTDLFLYYVFCYGMLIFGICFILSFLAKFFWLFCVKLMNLKLKKKIEKIRLILEYMKVSQAQECQYLIGLRCMKKKSRTINCPAPASAAW